MNNEQQAAQNTVLRQQIHKGQLHEHVRKPHSKTTAPTTEKANSDYITPTRTCIWILTLMVRRTPMGRLLEGGANKVSLSVIGWPVDIVLLRKSK